MKQEESNFIKNAKAIGTVNKHVESLKDKNKIQIIGAFMLIAVLIIMMTYTGICMLFQLMKKLNFSNDFLDKLYVFESESDINYAELYPFENSIVEKNEEKNIIEKYKEIVEKIKDKSEKCTNKRLIGYEKFVENSYLYNELVGYKLVSNSNSGRIEVENGFFSFLIKERDITKAADKLIELKEYLNNLDVDLIYVQAPAKISENQKISDIYKDYSNENMNNLLNAIKGKVDYIDLRENINKSNLNYLKIFYKTDHHWLPETGLWATKEISNYLNNYYGMNLETANIDFENYNMQIYPKMYLGSDGKYVSLKNAKPEDFTLITPKFDTKLNVKILDEGIDKTDTFENTLIEWSRIKYEDYYKSSQYAAYLYGNISLAEIHNELVYNGKKILLVRDSFCEVVAPFLALENEYLSVIDLRHFNGSLKTYINQFEPDMVIVMYNGSVVADLTDTSITDDLIDLWNFE